MKTNRRKIISVIGDAGIDSSTDAYKMAYLSGMKLVDSGFRIATGAGGGVMEAAAKGASESSFYREGDIIGILRSDDINDNSCNDYIDIPIPTGMGYGRNIIVASFDGVVAIGGGAGTLSEIALSWQFHKPVFAWQGCGWSKKVAGEEMDERHREKDESLQIVHPFSTVDELHQLLIKYFGI